MYLTTIKFSPQIGHRPKAVKGATMDVKQFLSDAYGLTGIKEIRELTKSGACYQIVTNENSYVLKHIGRPDFISIYDKVQRTIGKNGTLEGSVISTKNGSLMAGKGFALMVYIPGEAVETYSDEQFWSIVADLNEYNKALRQVPFVPNEIEQVNTWDQAKSTEFICKHTESIIQQCGFDSGTVLLFTSARNMLAAHRDHLLNNKKQLIHSDLGPGNIIFHDNKIRAIIDFTPEYEHELYSLTQFLYWTCLRDFHGQSSIDRIKGSLQVYYGRPVHQRQPASEELFLYLIKSCLFRALGPVLSMIEDGSFDKSKINSRIAALETLMDIRRAIS
jgi:hypothetical protein